jgi:hypothetical protein
MMKHCMIDYGLVGQAQTFYKALGYINLDLPWLVSPQAIVATLPAGKKIFQSNFGCLVGSGEQSFIQMMMDGTLKPGKYQTTTPCFRDEEPISEFSRLNFLKTELIWYMPDVELKVAYDKVLNDALSCFFEISHADTLDAVQTSEGFDICCNGIELGSYGVRKMGEHTWVFGTGLAEPRFSMTVNRRLTPEILEKQRADELEQERLEHEAMHLAGHAHSHDPNGILLDHNHEPISEQEETSVAQES